MNADEQYVPSEEQVRVAYMGDRITYDGLSGEEALGEWTAFLARVRRDAARSGYYRGYYQCYSDRGLGRDYSHAYPEETP